MAHVLFRNHKIVAAIISPSNDDVGVRMSGIEMVNSYPIKLGAEISFNLCHHVTDKGFEISKLCPIIRRYNQPELVTVTITGIEKDRSIGFVDFWTIELTGFTLWGNAVSLNIAKMGAGGSYGDGGPRGPERVVQLKYRNTF